MNVLMIANCSSLYGANTSMLEYIKYLRGKDINVYVWLPEKGAVIRELCRLRCKYKVLENYIGVHHIGTKKAWERGQNFIHNMRVAIKHADWIKKKKIDIIHTNSSTVYIGAILSVLTGIPHVWHVREFMQTDYNFEYDIPFICYRLLKKADRVIFISNAVKQHWERNWKYDNSCIIYNGFSLDKYVIKKDLSSKETYSILLAGVIQPTKGQLEAVKAIHILVKMNIRNIRLQIVGDGDLKYINQIKKYIKEYQLGDYIIMFPFKNDLSNMRKEAQIALMCSASEALGRVTIESMASQLLVIGTNSGGTSELIRDGENGYLYEVSDYRQLAEKIKYAIEHWEEAQEIIKSAQENVLESFSIALYGKKMLKLYADVLN